MKVMERELYTDKNGRTAEIIRHPKGYRVTIWEGWSITFREVFLKYSDAFGHIDGMNFVVMK